MYIRFLDCLAVKACQQHKYLIVLYIEKLLKHNINRMRGLIKLLQQRYGKITIKTYRKWEKIEIKLNDYRNHLRFSLRCLDRGLIPVSLRLKNLLRTQRGKEIIYKTERRLLNERIKNINMTLKHYEQEGYMYQHDLKQQIEQNWWEESKAEINKVRELRHNTMMERQIRKFTKLLEEKEKHQERHVYHSGHTNYIDHTKADGSIKPSNSKKWVINLSSIPLTKDQELLLEHGPNFAITPQRPLYGEYIKAIETACQSLDVNSAEELRSDVYRVLRHPRQLRTNLSKEEMTAIKQLKADKDRIILTADKGVALVVMDQKEYIEKAKELLQDTNTYKTILSDSTIKLKNKLINKLKKIKLGTRMDDITYRRMYPTGTVIPKFYGLPKVHKANTPLRPIVSSIGSVSYGVAKELARIIKPLVGSTEHHVNNSKEFIEEIKKIKLEEGECITSYDVSALFTSIPIPSALDIINKLLQDADLQNRTNMTTPNIIELLDFCLNNTYFTFQGVFYQQTKGAAMGSPVSPIVANIFMEAFESRA